MARPKLTNEQRVALLTWLAADYDTRLIQQWFKEKEWPELSRQLLDYYRKRFVTEIEAHRTQRRESAISSGLALKEERIKRLAEHADELEAIKWLPDKNGRLWNEAAWRETLDEIAKEMGHRKIPVEHGGQIAVVTADDLAKARAEAERWERERFNASQSPK